MPSSYRKSSRSAALHIFHLLLRYETDTWLRAARKDDDDLGWVNEIPRC